MCSVGFSKRSYFEWIIVVIVCLLGISNSLCKDKIIIVSVWLQCQIKSSTISDLISLARTSCMQFHHFLNSHNTNYVYIKTMRQTTALTSPIPKASKKTIQRTSWSHLPHHTTSYNTNDDLINSLKRGN